MCIRSQYQESRGQTYTACTDIVHLGRRHHGRVSFLIFSDFEAPEYSISPSSRFSLCLLVSCSCSLHFGLLSPMHIYRGHSMGSSSSVLFHCAHSHSSHILGSMVSLLRHTSVFQAKRTLGCPSNTAEAHSHSACLLGHSTRDIPNSSNGACTRAHTTTAPSITDLVRNGDIALANRVFRQTHHPFGP